MERHEALAAMQEAAVLWSVGQVPAAEIVRLACELLVAGFDGFTLAILAGVSGRNANEEVPCLLDDALEEVGLKYHAPESQIGLEAAVRVLASRALAGLISPEDLVVWAHSTVGHDRLAIAERLVEIDDVHDTLEYTDMTEQDLDREILEEARRVVADIDRGA